MKSIKPGRGPSMMGAIGGIGAALFGVFWVIAAIAMGGWFMAPFGIIFIVMAVITSVYDYKNATSKNRHSIIDIVDESEEPDPFNEYYGGKDRQEEDDAYIDQENLQEDGYVVTTQFCPYCGTKAAPQYEFCRKCGKRLP